LLGSRHSRVLARQARPSHPPPSFVANPFTLDARMATAAAAGLETAT